MAPQLPNFSELDKVKTHAPFGDENGPSDSFECPATMQITHVGACFLSFPRLFTRSLQISAHYERFFAYSTGASSIVLMGSVDTKPSHAAEAIPALQNRSVVSVQVGDYHFAALTASGKLFTWGAYSNGACGLGDPGTLEPGTPGAFATREAANRRRSVPPRVDVPTEVRFDHASKKRKERFCFSVTACGWHTGALVIDLEVRLFFARRRTRF